MFEEFVCVTNVVTHLVVSLRGNAAALNTSGWKTGQEDSKSMLSLAFLGI